MQYVMPSFETVLAAIQEESKESIEIYLPEPQGIKSMLKLPPKQRNAWLKAYKSELKNLIEDNETFVIETPRKGEKVIPTKPVFKAKQTQDGKLEKLKVREVARGDLQFGVSADTHSGLPFATKHTKSSVPTLSYRHHESRSPWRPCRQPTAPCVPPRHHVQTSFAGFLW
jgi:hypothetical protein